MLTVRMLVRLIAWLAVSVTGASSQVRFLPPLSSGDGLYSIRPDTSQAARRTVTGSVVNSLTGEPIRRALVHINSREQHAGFTGSDGRFEITNVPDGPAQVSTEKPGYSPPGAAGRFTFTPPTLVTIGPATGELQLKLMPQSRIEGRVTGVDGEPIEGIVVLAMTSQIVNGKKQWQQNQNGLTDEDGKYRIEKLTAGSYIMKTAQQEARDTNTEDARGQHPPNLYPTQFYPNSPDIGSAQPLQLQPGETAITDFTLKPVASYSVSGSLTGVRQGVGSMCIDGNGELTGTELSFDDRTMRFTVSHLPAGACTLHFESRDAEGQAAVADVPIQIGASDIKGQRIELRPLTSMPIHFTGGSGKQGNIQVELTSMSRLNPPTVLGQATDAQHPLEVKGIEPDTYKVSVHFFGEGCVGSVLAGGRDLLRENLTVLPGAVPSAMEISIREDCATLSGSVKGLLPANGQTGGGLLLIPETSGEPTMIPLPPGGDFTFANLTPGTYHLFAFTSIDGLEYANPESLRSFDGQEVDLGPNEKASVQVNLITRSAS